MSKVYSRFVKRIIDVIASLSFVVLFWWLLVIVALMVRLCLGSPVLFKQKRPGRNDEIFELYKFRTMTDERDMAGELLPDEMRLTPFGLWLRSTSLDELPEVLNILKGEMSFVGPRPLLVEYLPLYDDRQRRRHEVRPGLTGLAQCRGRNLLRWEERFELDIEYVESCSFVNDAKIIAETARVVFQREGISSSDSATMEPFHGSSNCKTKEIDG